MTPTLLRTVRAAALAAVLPCLAPAHARAADHPGPPGPPPEAFSACDGKSAQDACEAPLPEGTVAGTCVALDGGALACRPDRPPPHHRGPPPEAIAACAGESAGAACAVTLRGDTLDGTCTTEPTGDTLACRPARMSRPPER